MALFLPVESRLKHLGFNLIAGVDEVGRGSLAGPVVSAAVILKDNVTIKDLDDSKKVQKIKREQLFKEIIKKSIDFSITAVSHKIIDKVNILESIKIANCLCIKNLKIKPNIVLIDGIDKQRLKSPYVNVKFGDSKVKCIAAASILAKVFRDKLMEYYSNEFNKYKFEKNVGYGTREHRSNIKRFGLCEIHRKSYKIRLDI